MGTVTQNIKAFIEKGNKHNVKVVDSRGELNYLASFGFLLVAWFQVLHELIVRKEAAIMHINVSERSSFYRKACFIWLAKRFNVKTILHHHGAAFIPFYNNSNYVSKRIVQYCVCSATENIVLGQKWKSFIETFIPNHSPISIMFNAVPRREYTKTVPAIFTISLIANLSERKGVMVALNALSQIQDKIDCHIHFVGGGDVERYQDIAKKMNIEGKCSFHGWVSRDKTFEVMTNSNVLILPSYEEGLPMVVLEAMAHKIPVVCTPVGSLGEVFTHDKELLFVDVGSAESLSEALVALANSKTLSSRLSECAHETYLSKFSIEEYMKCLLNIYER